MKPLLIALLLICFLNNKTAAQQNWAAVPCNTVDVYTQFSRMWVDSLHNEIILSSIYGYSVCNTKYKGIVAYSESGFRDLDLGVSTHRLGNGASGDYVTNLITYGNKTLYGGGFLTVGKDTLKSKSLALWNGAKWDTFPKHVFTNDMNEYSGGGFRGFLKYNGKLWMYGGFDTIGGVITRDIATFDGNNFSPVPTIPVNNRAPILKLIPFKNKLIALGTFYNNAPQGIDKLAQFDGVNWTPMATGVKGSLKFAWDIIVYKDTLYVAGNFSKSEGNAGNYIMKWDGVQFSDAGFGNWCGFGRITRLLIYRDRLYTMGGFSCADGKKAFGVAYYEGGNWTVPQDSIEGNGIFDAVVYNNGIYIGGSFKSINGDTTIQKFARLLCPDFDAASGCLSGLKENNRNSLNLKVFPNPANSKITVEFDKNIPINKLTILNTLGQLIHTEINPSNKKEIDIRNLATGIYFIQAENNLSHGVIKFIKE